MRVISPVKMEMSSLSTTPNYKPQNRALGRPTSKDKRGSKTYSSSEDDFHSDDNLRPYEEVKTALHDKKLNALDSDDGGGCKRLSWFLSNDQEQVYNYPKQLLLIPYSEGITTGNEYMSTPITPLMDKATNKNIPTHKKLKGRTHSATSTSSNGRLYSYVSGSDGDEDENDNDTSSSSNRRRRHWRKGSPHSTISSSNEMDTYRMRNDQVSHLSLSEDSDGENGTPSRYSQTGTMPLPPPSAPPPPPPPIEDIPQRGQTTPQHQQLCKHHQLLQQQRSLQFGPQIRGNYSDVENIRRGLPSDNHEHLRRLHSDSECMCAHTRGANHYSEGDSCEYEPHYLVQTPNGSVFIPQSQVLGPDGQPRFPRTVPRSGSIPLMRNNDLQSPNGGVVRPLEPTTMPRQFAAPPDQQPQNIVLNDRVPNGSCNPQNHEYQEAWDTQNFVYPHQFTTTSPTIPFYPSGQLAHYDKFHSTKHEWKEKLRERCSWRCLAIIVLVLMLLISLGVIAYLLKTRYVDDAVEVDAGTTSRDGGGGYAGSTLAPPSLPIAQYQVGDKMEQTIPPKAFWTSQFNQPDSKFVKINLTVPDDGIFGIYGRRGASPSIAQFDFFDIIDGRTLSSRVKRSPKTLETALSKYLEAGVWFISVYNDQDDAQTVTLKTDFYKPETGCPGDCFLHGSCVDGQCQCFPGYTGWDCNQKTCPLLCSGNGMYIRGQCQCHTGWKGIECDIRENECVVPNCNGNGVCVDGKCECHEGFKGVDCGSVDCLMPNCSGNGVCALGECVCYKGFKGTDCSIPDKLNITHLCTKNCSGHGIYNVEEGKCECERFFTGKDCDTEKCRLECYHGYCHNQRCLCYDGWSGALCDQLKCDPRCDGVRGNCNNGTCQCLKGYNGKHCSLDGCPSDCSNNGVCTLGLQGYSCKCRPGWKGEACDVSMEMQCKDHVDNDGDGLRDCMDPDCCSSTECEDNLYCRASPDPAEILLRKQAPSTTASFYEKMKFLVEENSVQMDTSKNAFNESQVSVIRGKVQSVDKTPLVGVRVDIDKQPLYGYTRTREHGLFDILVNGGGSVTLKFSRQPFLTRTVSVLVPWNQIITMETVVMALIERDILLPDPSLCGVSHDHYKLQPVVLSTWQHTQLGSCPEKSTIIPESQVLQESISIPGTSVNLVYHSSETPGYRSVIMIQMTTKDIPLALAVVHLRVSVEGIQFEKTFEADSELKYTYAWDRRNAYRQKVYGIVPVRVNVGYQYSGCGYIFWETRSSTMSGFDLTSSEIGRWNLDIHHTYNFQEGILHKGDGTNIYLKEKPKKLISILGSGQRRRADCDGCNGPARDNRLLAPVALASSRDGSLYVWDYNFIRKLSPSREEIASILQIMTYTSHKPYMTVSPVDSRLYISDYMNRRIIHVKTMGPVRELEDNFEVVAGTGDECTPGERDLCGDGKQALTARFLHPKGIAINKDGVIYIADGANIRKIDTNKIISTVIGSQDQPKAWKPMSCDESMPADQVRLNWPTTLAIDPLDDTLHILDDNIVLKLTKDNRVVTVAGRPITCPQKDVSFLPMGVLTDDEQASSIADHVKLVQPESLSFGPNGDLYILESDTHHINRVRVVTTDGRIHHFAGTKSKCDCQQSNCRCYDPTENSAAQALFEELTSITVTPDGIVHFADSGNLRVFSVISELPTLNWLGQYEVVSTETKELYIFNRYGQQIHTVNLMTDQYMYNFTYNINSFYGRLVAVTDNAGKSVQIERDYDRQAKEIISPTGEKSRLQTDNMQRLQKFHSPDNTSFTFTYDATSGLLQSKKLSDGKIYMYTYDEMGRLLSAIQPTGEVTHLHTDVNATGSIVHVTTDNSNTVAMATYGSVQSALHGASETKVTYLPDGAVVVVFPSNLTIALESGGNPVLENQHRMHFKRKLIAPNKLVHRLEWRFFLRRKGRPKESVQKLGRRMRVGEVFTRHDSMLDSHEEGGYKEKALLVNGENLLTIEYDRDTHTETILDKDLHEIITTAFDNSGLPTHFLPAKNHHSLNVTYNAGGEIIHWKYGDLEERRIFESGVLKERTGNNGAQYRYNYRYGKKPTDIHLPSGLQYYLQYDEEGNLMMLRTPGLGRHYFYRIMMAGSQRFFYQVPDLDLPYIEDYNGGGKLQQVIFPSEYRKVVYKYNHFSQPTLVIFGDTEINFEYDPNISMISSAETKGRGYKLLETFRYDSSLISTYTIEFPDDVRLLDGKFDYIYDKNFRIMSVEGVFAKNKTTSNTYSYDDTNGFLKKVKNLNIQWPLVDREKIYDEHVVMSRELDMYGRLQNTQYVFRDNIRFKLGISYDEMNRIGSWNRLIGQTDACQYSYTYDIDGNLIEVSQDGVTKWRYGYDNNGNINRIEQNGLKFEMAFDAGDKIKTFDKMRYKFDLDGFMVQRHDEDLLFNSYGQMVSVTNSGLFKFSYHYDHQSRIVSQGDRLGNIMQYFYADVTRKHLVTHTYNHSNLEMTQYFYDSKGKLIAFERQNKLNYVATDPMGSPLVIFDENGLIIKQISYDPLGKVISDSNPNYEFSFGFQGGLFNPTTKLVHYGKRVYDTMIGRYVNPDYNAMLRNLRYLTEDPLMMNNYHHRFLVNTHLQDRRFPTLDTAEWLKLLGFDLDSMAPNVGYDGTVRPQPDAINHNLLPTSSAFECTFHRDMLNMLSISTVPQSRVSPIQKFVTIAPAPKQVLYSDLLLTSVNSEVMTAYLDSSPAWSKKFSAFLNQSEILDLRYTIHGREVLYFVKPDASVVNDELKVLGIHGNAVTYENNINVTVNRHSHQDGYRIHSYTETDVRFHGNFSVINIRYGSNFDHERQRVIRHAKERAVHHAWAREKWLIQNSLPTYHSWTEHEKTDIVTTGYSDGFDIQYERDPNKFPNIADDCNNVKFVKVKR
ncbi:teneurin-m-like isoform X5 [Mercenaria mercenaria]|uniref:teneurin-m-like isoform X5 n=1 Tax=Mercenaria mercenaria TaxID=6596 RepID=UPI00234F94DD|nr:teneurin-m-like isoform X5 [Mercenaria mercenaria]